MQLNFVEGDACNPNRTDGVDVIVHCVNDEGIMGGGIALAIKKKWPAVYKAYADLFQEPAYKRATAQGQIQTVPVENGLFVINLFGQSGIGGFEGLPAIRYGAVEEGFLRIKHILLARDAEAKGVTLHLPRLGAGLAGGSWASIEAILNRVFNDVYVDIIVYDFPGTTFKP